MTERTWSFDRVTLTDTEMNELWARYPDWLSYVPDIKNRDKRYAAWRDACRDITEKFLMRIKSESRQIAR